jgi:hypothetical protein
MPGTKKNRRSLATIKPHFKRIILQQQKILDNDCDRILRMVARDDSGKGDWGVYRKVRGCWRNSEMSSEDKWALLESEVERLRGGDSGQTNWAVSSNFGCSVNAA